MGAKSREKTDTLPSNNERALRPKPFTRAKKFQ